MEQIKHVLSKMPVCNEIECRNRALVAFTLLTGARDSAIASLKLKHVDLIAGCVNQDAREVKTKFSKTFSTFFFPAGEEVREIVTEWVSYLRNEKLWSNDDPLFPATLVALGPDRQFTAAGLSRQHWSNASAIRKIFREAFVSAGLPYFHPHSFRNTLVQLGQQVCKTPEEFKAWSQNLGHEKVLTTFLSYGEITCQRQGEIIHKLASPQRTGSTEADELPRQCARSCVRLGWMYSKKEKAGMEEGIKNMSTGESSNLAPLTINIWGYFWGYIKI